MSSFHRQSRFVVALLALFALVGAMAPRTTSAFDLGTTENVRSYHDLGLAAPVYSAQADCRTTTGRLDVVFLIDQTGSMINVVNTAKREASVIASKIRASVPDTAFGVASFSDYPIPGTGYGISGDVAYTQQSEISEDVNGLQEGLNKITSREFGGGDEPEAYSRAIFEMKDFNWRSGSTRVVVLMGDSSPHSKNTPLQPYDDGLIDPGRDGALGTGDDLEALGEAVDAVRAAKIRITGLAFQTDSYSRKTEAAFQFVTNGQYESYPTSASIADPIVKGVSSVICDTIEEATRAFVTVVQRPNPNLLAARGSLVTYTIVATNRDKGIAKNTTITMPFNPAEVEVVDAKFSTPGAWVSRIVTNTLEMQTGEMRTQDVVTATVRLRVLDEVPVGTNLGERLSYTWNDSSGIRTGTSNITVVGADTTSNNVPYYQIFVTPVEGPAGSTHTFATGVFAPNEPVALWYYGADGATQPLEGMLADANGGMIVKYTTQGLKPGRYTMVAYGNWTAFTATGTFDVK